jgi:hypothetical protein
MVKTVAVIFWNSRMTTIVPTPTAPAARIKENIERRAVRVHQPRALLHLYNSSIRRHNTRCSKRFRPRSFQTRP